MQFIAIKFRYTDFRVEKEIEMIRTLHCSKNTKNYKLCLENEVAGFTHRGPAKNDLVYLLFKKGKNSYCGARFVLNEVTDEKPWEDSDRYVLCYKVVNIEYCTPFEVSILKKVGGEYWPLKYLQGAKEIKDPNAVKLLETAFNENKVSNIVDPDSNFNGVITLSEDDCSEDDEISQYSDKEIEKISQEVPEVQINIMGTFQTVNFVNETDPFKGLEKLVIKNFFDLFPQFNSENSILISENRLFKTQRRDVPIAGVTNIPDGLLITFDKSRKCPIHLYIVEYECFGENKSGIGVRTNYMNSHIIPQLMQFASSFSVITDQQTRDKTVANWIDKIKDATSSDELISTVDKWMRTLFVNIKERDIVDKFKEELRKAFKQSVHVFLIIDDLSDVQKQTIENIINSFKLEDSTKQVEFKSAVVKLVQKINFIDQNNEYGLTVQ